MPTFREFFRLLDWLKFSSVVLCHLTIKFLSLWRLKKPWLTSLWKFFLRVISQWVKISRDEDWDLKKKAWKVLGTERYLHIYPTSIKRILFRDSFPWLFSVTLPWLFRDSFPWLFSVTLFRSFVWSKSMADVLNAIFYIFERN